MQRYHLDSAHKWIRNILIVVFFFAIVTPGIAHASATPASGTPDASSAGEERVFLPFISGGMTPIVPDTTNVLSDETTEQISSISSDGSVFTFADPTAELEDIEPGEVIVGDISEVAPYGFLREVIEVSSTDDEVILVTQETTLEQAIQQGSIQFRRKLSPNDVTVSMTLEGVELQTMSSSDLDDTFFIAINNVVIYDDDGNRNTTYDQIKANGRVELAPDLDFSLVVEDWKLQELSFTSKVTETASLELAAEVELASFEREVELARYYLSPITVWAGIPVVFVPVITINVGAEGDVHVGVTTSVTQEATFTAGLEFENDTWSPVKQFTNEFGYEPPSLTAGLALKGYAGTQISLLLYGITGPYTEVNAFLRLEADIFATPWWALYGGLEVPVGVKVEVLGHELADYEKVVIGYEILLAQAEANLAPYMPVGPSPYDGAIGQAAHVTLQWSGGDPDGDSVTYDVYIEANDGSPDQLKCHDVSSTSCYPGALNANTHYFWQVVASDEHGLTTTGPVWDFWTGNNPPYMPTGPNPYDGATNQATDVTLQWSGGDPDGDSVTYDVYIEANDSSPDQLKCNGVSGASCAPGTLNANTHYYWKVVARDSYGATTTGPTWDFTTGNNPPYTPTGPIPSDGATNQSTNATLQWDGGDPDSDSVTYDVYIEAYDSSPDQLKCNDVSNRSCDPGTLDSDTHYYWKVVARDMHGATTSGPVWHFWTEEEDIKVDVALIIDSSGSMRDNDPNDLRKESSKVFIDAMENGDQVAVISFDAYSRAHYDLQALSSNRSVPKSKVDNIGNTGSSTNISAGLITGHQQLSSSSTDYPKAAVLMTDGVGTYNDEAALYAASGWRVFTIGLGAGVDADLLQDIAYQTGGQYYLLTDPNQLIGVYLDILNTTTGSNSLLNQNLHLNMGQTQYLDVDVPGDLSTLNFTTTWPGSNVETTLTDPTGRSITPGTAATDPNIYYAHGDTYELYRITDPRAGNWRIRLYGDDLPAGGEEVNMTVSARGGEFACAEPAAGIISWWPGNGNTQDSVDGNPGTLYDGTTYSTGKVDQAFNFNGSSELRIQSQSNLNVQTYTIEAWIFPTALDGKVEIIVNKEPNTGWHPSQIQYELAIKGAADLGSGSVPEGNLLFYMGGINNLPNGYQGWADGGGPIPLYSWSHVALTFDGSTAKTYINGALKQEVNGLSGSIVTSSGPLKIGSRSDENVVDLPKDQFDGLIDEPAIYNRALSAQEIQSIYTAGSSGKCPGSQ